MAMLAILVLPLMFLGWTAVAMLVPSAVSAMNNPGPHGFTEVLYAYTSQTGNNGSAFAGLSANTVFYNLTGAVAMFVGRFWMIIPTMAIAELARRQEIGAGLGRHLPDHRRPVRRSCRRRHPHHRRPDLLSGARPWSAGRAALDRRRYSLFSELIRTDNNGNRRRSAIAGPYRHSSIRRLSFPRSARLSSSSIRRTLMKNPVMFVLEVVTALTTVILHSRSRRRRPSIGFRVSDHPVAVVHGAVRQLRHSGRGRPRQGAGRDAAPPAHRDAGQALDRRTICKTIGWCPQHQSESRRRRSGRGRRSDPIRRRSDRRHGLGQRGRHHRRIGAGHSRVGRRPLGGDRRNASAVGLDSRAHHRGARLDLSRPHDQAGRRRRTAKDAERDRARYPSRRADDHLRVRDRDHSELRRLRRTVPSPSWCWWRCS